MKRLKQAFSKRSKQTDGNKLPTKGLVYPQPQPYHHIPLGSGGVLSREAFRNIIRSAATFVGTTATFDTVGVFFEISDTKCFVAHIDAHITRPSSTGPSTEHHATNYKTTALLRAALIARLHQAVTGERIQRMRETLTMTCARLSGRDSRAAEVVAKTIREWLGAELSGGGRVAAIGSSFVVGWPAAGSLMFQQTPPDEWTPIECSIGQGAWTFEVEEGELDTSDEAW